MNILVIAPHPDDEVLGMGATIKKLSQKNDVTLLVMTDGASAQYDDRKMIQVRRESCKKSSKILGIKKIEFLEFQDMKLDSVYKSEIMEYPHPRSIEAIKSLASYRGVQAGLHHAEAFQSIHEIII